MHSALPRLVLFIGDIPAAIADAIKALGNTTQSVVKGYQPPVPAKMNGLILNALTRVDAQVQWIAAKPNRNGILVDLLF